MWISLIADFLEIMIATKKWDIFNSKKLLQNQKVKLEIFRSFYASFFTSAVVESHLAIL